tara:strand:- start:1161 stop:1562 length:402 start_codon:yes stop_codon:yes gene_type:complete
MLNKLFKSQFRLNLLTFQPKLFLKDKRSISGIIYTLYSDKYNYIEVGFAENNKILEKKMISKNFILLDKKEGKKNDLFLLRKTLKILKVELLDKNYYENTQETLRHLKTLAWPIGNSLYKQRIIRKKISYALI